MRISLCYVLLLLAIVSCKKEEGCTEDLRKGGERTQHVYIYETEGVFLEPGHYHRRGSQRASVQRQVDEKVPEGVEAHPAMCGERALGAFVSHPDV